MQRKRKKRAASRTLVGLRAVASHLGVHRNTVVNWRRDDAEFQSLFDVTIKGELVVDDRKLDNWATKKTTKGGAR